jgi:hypothetical protein
MSLTVDGDELALISRDNTPHIAVDRSRNDRPSLVVSVVSSNLAAAWRLHKEWLTPLAEAKLGIKALP